MMQKEPEKERTIVDMNDIGGRGTLVTSENVDEILEEMNKPIEDASYTVRMNSDWDFPSGKTKSTNAFVANGTDNKRTVYFDIVLDDTNELVYSSPFMPVGTDISKFALDVELGKGIYYATVVYHLVDDDLKEITTASVSVTLNVEK